jgi:ribosomal protein L3
MGELKKWNVRVSDTRTDRNAYIRRGAEIYRHPKGYFVTLEFQGKIGNFRESFRPSELIKVV